MLRHYSYYFICLLTSIGLPVYAIDVTPSDVYAQIAHIHDEITLIKQHLNITEDSVMNQIRVNLSPRHTWQKCYEILYKLNILRQKYNFPVTAIPSRFPSLNPPTLIVYEQAERILTEINLLKFYLGVTATASPPSTFTDKTITDNYNLLDHISLEIDLLNGTTFTPSHVFAQAMRVNEDVNDLVNNLGLQDTTLPPPKELQAKPADAFEMALLMLVEVRRLQSLANLESVDFYVFKPNREITPSDVFSLIGIVLAEIQPLKAHLGMKYTATPPANHYDGRVPADVRQVLGWSLRKLQLIRSLN